MELGALASFRRRGGDVFFSRLWLLYACGVATTNAPRSIDSTFCEDGLATSVVFTYRTSTLDEVAEA